MAVGRPKRTAKEARAELPPYFKRLRVQFGAQGYGGGRSDWVVVVACNECGYLTQRELKKIRMEGGQIERCLRAGHAITINGGGNMTQRMEWRTQLAIGAALLVAYIGCVFGANWAGEKYGIVDIGFGLTGPAGLYFVGLALTLRDGVQEALGRWWVWVGILIGAALSYTVAPAFATASAVAFLLAEGMDWIVYTPLRARDWGGAVLASNAAGAVVDSIVYLWIAFGWAAVGDFWFGQTVGKLYMAAPFVLALWAYRVWRGRDLLIRVRAA